MNKSNIKKKAPKKPTTLGTVKYKKIYGDYYKILGISPHASQEDIRKSYRKLSLQFHPDVSSSKDAEQTFKKINEAHEVLSDATSRKRYDKNHKIATSTRRNPKANPDDLRKNIYSIDAILNGGWGKLSPKQVTSLLERRSQFEYRFSQIELSEFKKTTEYKAHQKRPLPRSTRTKSNVGRKRKLTSKEITSIREQYERGNISMRSLASEYGVSVSTMHEYLKGILQTKRKAKSHKIPDDQLFIVVRLYRNQGMTMDAIARNYNVSTSTVWRAIRERAKFTAKYERPRTQRRARQEQEKRQPKMNIDYRIGANKRKRGIKHAGEGRVKIIKKYFGTDLSEEQMAGLKGRIEHGGKVKATYKPEDVNDYEALQVAGEKATYPQIGRK